MTTRARTFLAATLGFSIGVAYMPVLQRLLSRAPLL